VHGIDRDTLIDGRYRVEHRLGSGGMADVWCVEDEQLGRRVALKLLAHRLAEDDAFRERFRREASAAAGLQHPHIVGIFDRGEWDGTPYIAMEFVAGRTLKQLVLEEGPLDAARAVDLTIQVLRALRYAHKHGIVHRDVKPQNVILDEEGEAKVADFGIAHAGASDMTETGSIVGTAQYLSPEQAQGQPVSPRSDLYSVGVMLYELLTGRVPFEASSPVSVALKQVSERPVPPSQLRPGISPALESVVLRALEKDPERRFADANEFIAALQAALRAPEHVVLEPTPGEPWEALEEPEPSRRPWWVWLLALLVLAALAAGAYLLFAPKRHDVPNVVGATSARAAQTLHKSGFEVRIVNAVNATTPRDHVIAQDPAAGARAREGTTVTLTVSAGPGQAPVPMVKGLSRADAEQAVSQAGLRSKVHSQTSDTVPSGTVIDSQPAQGTEVDKGSTVTLLVSKGKAKVTVPNVNGLDSSTAQGELRQAGLDVTLVEQVSSSADPGTVLGQDPGAGASVPRGTVVHLTVAKRPPKVAVPDVTSGNPTEADARAKLTGAGFKVHVDHRTAGDTTQVGKVIDQSPAAGEHRSTGATVTIVVGTAAPTPTPSPTPSPTASPSPSPTATKAP
jgi:eukaryotic-like serine/threonine-protein kinase